MEKQDDFLHKNNFQTFSCGQKGGSLSWLNFQRVGPAIILLAGRLLPHLKQVNPFVPSGFFYFNSLVGFISCIRGVLLVFIIVMFVEISELHANSVDPDQMPHSVASDLDLHCQCPFYGTLGLYGLKGWVLFLNCPIVL